MKTLKILKATGASALVALSFTYSHSALATPLFLQQAHEQLASYTLDCAYWYAGGNIGFSHLHDNGTPGLVSSVDENGPGWSADIGYQFNSFLGAELGYTQYHDSRETSGTFNIAKTEHYAAYLAATARYPLFYKFSVLGKLGAAYSYANKIYTTFGFAKSSGSGSLYWGLGLAYSFTPKVDFILQGASARGNHLTGSSDLYSIGLKFAIV